MTLGDKTAADVSPHKHDDNQRHQHQDNPAGQSNASQSSNKSSELFEMVRNYQGDRFKPVDDETRKSFYQILPGKSFTIKQSDFISLDNSNFKFSFVPAHDDHHCDLNVLVTNPKRSAIQLTAFDESVLTFLSESSFVIKSYVKLDDNKVHSKYYAMSITVVENPPSADYVFSFSFTNLEDEDKKIRVYVNHKQPATAGVGRE